MTTIRSSSATSTWNSSCTRTEQDGDNGASLAGSGRLPADAADLVHQEIGGALAPVADLERRGIVDEIGVEDAVAGADFWSDGVDRVPGVGADREGVACIRRARHPVRILETPARLALGEARADVVDVFVLRQVEL